MDDRNSSKKRLPQLLQDRVQFTTEVACGELSRLSSVCLSSDTLIRCEFRFDVETASKQPLVHLNIQGELSLRCQRCLEPMPYPISYQNRLLIARSTKEADTIDSIYDTVICEEGYFEFRSIVDQELYLMIPHIPKHSAGECGYNPPESTVGKKNPFAVLKSKT